MWVFLCCLSWSNLTNSSWHSSQEGTGRVSCGQSNLASCMFCFSPWQWAHSKGGDWQVLWWCWSEYFWLNDFPHSEQVWAMSPCLVLLCHSKSAALLMLTLQMEQTRFPSMLTSTEAGGELKHWSKSGSICSRSNRNWVNESSFSHRSVLSLVNYLQEWRCNGTSFFFRFWFKSFPNPSWNT